MRNLVRRFWKDEQGLELSEYAVMAAIIVVLTVATIIALKDQIVTAFTRLTTAISGVNPI